MLLSCRAGGASDGSGDVHVQRPTSSRSTSSRASRCSPCCASGSASSRSRTAARRRASAAAAPCSSTATRGSRASRRPRGSRAGAVTTVEGLDPTRARPMRVGVRRDRRIAVRVLHARHRRCALVAARRPAARPGARRPPVPVHGLAHGVRSADRTAATVGAADRDLGRGLGACASSRAASHQRVESDVPLGGGGFADDTAPRDALVAVPLPPGFGRRRRRRGRDALGRRRRRSKPRAPRPAKVQGRRTTVDAAPPLPLLPMPDGGVRLATSWVEPAYLEPDASWCEPGGEPASPLANGGAFGGKEHSRRARRRARARRRTSVAPVRVVYSREDVVRLGPKRPPIAATAVWRDGRVEIDGVARASRCPRPCRRCRTASTSTPQWREVEVVGVRRWSRSCAPSASRSRRCSSKARSTRPASTVRR